MLGPWSPLTDHRAWLAFLAPAAIALMALVQLVWWYRARSTRRWRAALDAYAAREIAQDRDRKSPAGLPTGSHSTRRV